MNLRPASIFELVRLIDLQPPGQTGFCMLVVSSVAPELTTELGEELDVQISGSLSIIDVGALGVARLLEQLGAIQKTVVLMHGFASWSDDQFDSLDVNRSRLDSGAFLVFKVDFATAGRLLSHAPNLRSFLGANIFELAPDAAWMSTQEVAVRLEQLRTHFEFSDAEVIHRATIHDLPSDPDFAEWLLLLGRSELVD
jgi:hypothetical protein